MRSRHFAFAKPPVETEEEAVAREKEERRKVKTICAIKVGKDRYFWMAYRLTVWIESYYANGFREDAPASEIDGLDGEGFCTTMDEAIAAAQRVADSVPGTMEEKHHHRDAKGNNWISSRYKEVYARKPKPSDETDARPIGMFGSLWERAWNNWDCESYWIEFPITKITAKRVFIGRQKMATDDSSIRVLPSDYREVSQRSFDRATLENDGSVYWANGTAGKFFYSDAGKVAEEACDSSNAADYPLLGLAGTATRAEVMTAFRKLAKTAHPDAGGDATAFRALVAEKERALRP